MSEEFEFDNGFVNDPVFEQLGKVIDSASLKEEAGKKYRPVNTVVTDDNTTFFVSSEEAFSIKKILLSFPAQVRGDVLKVAQSKEGFNILLKYSKKPINDSLLLTVYQQMEMV